MKINLFKKAIQKFCNQKTTMQRSEMMDYFKIKSDEYLDNSETLYYKTKRDFKKYSDRVYRQ